MNLPYQSHQPTPEESMADHQQSFRNAAKHVTMARLFKPLTIVILPMLVCSMLGMLTLLWVYQDAALHYVGPSDWWIKSTAAEPGTYVILAFLSLVWLTSLHVRTYQILESGEKLAKAMEELATWGLAQLADRDAPIENQMAALKKKIHPRLKKINSAYQMNNNYTQSLLEEMEGKPWRTVERSQATIFDVAHPNEIVLTGLGTIGIGMASYLGITSLYHLYFFFTTIWSS